MSVDYKMLVAGFVNPIAIAKVLKNDYHADNISITFSSIDDGYYQIYFLEALTEEQIKINPIARRNIKRTGRVLHIFTEGSCASDYEDVCAGAMTMMMLGRFGDCEKIMATIASNKEGPKWIMDEEIKDEWVFQNI